MEYIFLKSIDFNEVAHETKIGQTKKKNHSK